MQITYGTKQRMEILKDAETLPHPKDVPCVVAGFLHLSFYSANHGTLCEIFLYKRVNT
jgi:hypothetical protein